MIIMEGDKGHLHIILPMIEHSQLATTCHNVFHLFF